MHAFSYACIHHVYPHIHLHVHMHVRVYEYRNIHTYTPTQKYTCTHVYMCEHVHIHNHKRTDIHMHIHIQKWDQNRNPLSPALGVGVAKTAKIREWRKVPSSWKYTQHKKGRDVNIYIYTYV